VNLALVVFPPTSNHDEVGLSFYKHSGDGFVLPDNEESESVTRTDIHSILPHSQIVVEHHEPSLNSNQPG